MAGSTMGAQDALAGRFRLLENSALDRVRLNTGGRKREHAAKTDLVVVGGRGVGDAPAPSPIEEHLARHSYSELDIEFDRRRRILWYFMNPVDRPCATVGLMENIKGVQAAIRECFAAHKRSFDPPLRYLVLASHIPGIFNLGGNLALFAQLIERRDRRALEDYAKLSIDVIHANHVNLHLPIITMSLVQGDALGGGFEAALCSNIVVAERSAKFGLPEILFGLFPGMGAYSFLSRKIGPVEAEKMIFSGKIYTAEDLHGMGVVDILAEDGCGEDAIVEHVERYQHRHNAHRSIYKVRDRVAGASYLEMMDIAMVWVDAALQIEPSDLKKMLRLAKAQDRRTATAKASED